MLRIEDGSDDNRSRRRRFFPGCSKVRGTDRERHTPPLSHSLPPLTSVTGPTLLPSLIFKMNESTRVSLISVDCRFVGRARDGKRETTFPPLH